MSREACANALDKALSTESPAQDTAEIAKSIESSIWSKTGTDTTQYKNQIRSKLNNIKSNPGLRSDLVNGTIEPASVADMTPEDMATPERKAEYEAIRQESIEESIMVNTLERHNEVHQNNDDLDTGIVRNTGQDGIEFDAPQAS